MCPTLLPYWRSECAEGTVYWWFSVGVCLFSCILSIAVCVHTCSPVLEISSFLLCRWRKMWVLTSAFSRHTSTPCQTSQRKSLSVSNKFPSRTTSWSWRTGWAPFDVVIMPWRLHVSAVQSCFWLHQVQEICRHWQYMQAAVQQSKEFPARWMGPAGHGPRTSWTGSVESLETGPKNDRLPMRIMFLHLGIKVPVMLFLYK